MKPHWFALLCDRIRHEIRRRTWPPTQALGRRAEDLAHRFLQRKGLIVIARNWQVRPGQPELDLVAWDGPSLVFVEVKARTHDDVASPERNIDADKQRQILRAARQFVVAGYLDEAPIRFDAVTVVFATPPRIEHLPDLWSRAGLAKSAASATR